MTRRLRAATWLWCAGCVAIATPARGEDVRAKIDAQAKPLLEQRAAVGFVIGVAQGTAKRVFGYGEVVKGAGDTPNADTVYEIGSISKAFTGTLLADMVQRRLVQLEDPLQKWAPDSVRVPIHSGQPITLLHLATHRSGLPRLPDDLRPADPANPYADYGERQMWEFLGKHALRRAPGEFEYSNYGVGLLGLLLARRAGCSYEQLLIDRICAPLKMNDTRVALTPALRERLAPPYDASLAPAKHWDLNQFAGAGGIRSTCHDMLTFAQASLAENKDPLALALRMSQEKRADIPNGLAIGLGWHIARDGVTRWHNGMTGGYHAWLAVVREARVAVVVLANTATERISQLGEAVTRIALGVDVPPPKPMKSVQVDEATLQKYAGVYALSPVFLLTVTVEDGKLMVAATGQPKFQVLAASPTEFFYTVVDARITFVLGDGGQPTKLILHQNGLHLDAPRQPPRQ